MLNKAMDIFFFIWVEFSQRKIHKKYNLTGKLNAFDAFGKENAKSVGQNPFVSFIFANEMNERMKEKYKQQQLNRIE